MPLLGGDWKMYVFDLSYDGLETVMKEYQILAMKFLWETGEKGAISKKVWLSVNEIMRKRGESISRASIINFLNSMVDKDALTFTERSGKGGYHRVYFPAFDEDSFKRHIADKVISKLLEIWPEEARAVLAEKIF